MQTALGFFQNKNLPTPPALDCLTAAELALGGLWLETPRVGPTAGFQFRMDRDQ